MNDLLKFLNDNKDALVWLSGSGGVIFILYKLISSLIHARRAHQTRSNENFPFKIIPPNSNVAKEVLGGADHDPLADRNIPYQQRLTGRNMRREIEDALTRDHYVLLVGKTGLGKTREAVHIAESLNKEGWTVLFLTREQWLAAPAKLPEGLPERKLLFLLDDLNRKMYASRVEQSPRADELLEPLTVPLQQRLEETLETFETLCGKGDVMVIATARNENFSQFSDEPNEWDKLEFKRYPGLWKRFSLFELPEPDDEAEASFLDQVTDAANVKANAADFEAIAKRNDGTFANMVENIRAAVNKDVRFGLDSFRDSLNGTWEKRYKDALARYALAFAVYDAVDLCRQAKLSLSFGNVYAASFLFLKSQFLWRPVDAVRLFSTLRAMQKAENILNPRDGQMEAKGYRLEIKPYLPWLYQQVFYETNRTNSRFKNLGRWLESRLIFIPASAIVGIKITRQEILWALFADLGWKLNQVGRAYGKLEFSEIEIACYEKSLALSKWNFLNPRRIRLGVEQWSNLGHAYYQQKQYEQAINACQKAIEIDPKFAYPRTGLGYVYLAQKQHQQAISAYQKAIEFDPKYATPWNGLGSVYLDQEQYEQAISAYQKAIEINPEYAAPWNGLGDVYHDQEQYEQAIGAYQKAIEINPKYVRPWNRLGYVYLRINEHEKALTIAQEAMALFPEQTWPKLLLLNILRRTGQDAARDEQEKMMRPLIESKGEYTRAYLASICGNVEEALTLLKIALEKKQVTLMWARRHPHFDFIRDDPRFKELVGLE